ncbi:trehalose-phosphatase [Variovorax sp. HJSM1_2]|uniref:trehalose-phosphatase n=1 Tax=Variovorax sp. HJSM1_2 TaxID=3366263 RepID=UPI003BE35BEC
MQTLPRLSQPIALFLDFDGSLVELADQPELVHVPASLVPLLTQLQQRLNGALAIITGRRIVDLDAFLAPLTLPAAGEHGARRRNAAGRLFAAAAPDLNSVIDRLLPLAERYPALRLERKETGVSLHYRNAPELEALCRETITNAIHDQPGLSLLHGKRVFEAKPVGVNKGRALEAFMQEAPFAGRQPVFVGDDVTDEAGFEVAQNLQGLGIKVGVGPSQALHRCPGPAAVLAWLEQLARPGTPEHMREDLPQAPH